MTGIPAPNNKKNNEPKKSKEEGNQDREVVIPLQKTYDPILFSNNLSSQTQTDLRSAHPSWLPHFVQQTPMDAKDDGSSNLATVQELRSQKHKECKDQLKEWTEQYPPLPSNTIARRLIFTLELTTTSKVDCEVFSEKLLKYLRLHYPQVFLHFREEQRDVDSRNHHIRINDNL